MSRVTSEEVQQLVPELDSDIDVSPFISVATNLVDDVLVGLVPELGTNRLHDIELFLAAHFVAVSYARTASEAVSSTSETVQFQVELNFNVTVFGQQALVLDTSGSLARLQKMTKQKGYTGPGSITWLGMTRTELDLSFGTEGIEE